MSAAPRLEFLGVQKDFERPVLRDLSLSVQPGEAYALLGRNGAGKTTAIRLLVGEDTDFDGTIRLLGCDSRDLDIATKERIGVVMENMQLYDFLTVSEIASYTRRFYPAWDEYLESALMERLELRGEDKVGKLSRGTRTKLGLLLAAPYRPDILILDDISGGLDVATRRSLLENIVQTLTEAGRSVLFSSHILTEVERVADRIGILHGGRLVAEGTPEEILHAVRRVHVEGAQSPPDASAANGDLRVETGAAGAYTLTARTGRVDLDALTAAMRPKRVLESPLDLEEIFIELTRGAADREKP